MRVESNFKRKAVYVVGTDGLLGLWTFMDEKFGNIQPVTAELNCSDEVTRHCENWEEVSRYSNIASKRIRKMTLYAGKLFYDHGMRVSLDDSESRSVSVMITCEEADIQGLRGSVEEILDGMRHGLLSRLSGKWQWSCISLLIVGLMWLMTIGVTSETVWPVAWQSMHLAGVAVILLTIFILAIVGDELDKRLMPKAHFTIGQGAVRYENWAKFWKMAGGACLITATLVLAIVGLLQ